jgi:hypothetical protein
MKELLLIVCSLFALGAGCAGTPRGVTTTVSPSTTTSSSPRYILTDPKACMAARYVCNAGEEGFSDEKGCGCRPIVGSDQPPKDQVCTKEYKPVCGEIEVQCIRAPCLPIKETFDNRCLAERAQAKNIKPGVCPQ